MTADTIQKIADDLEGFILLSDQQRKTLVDRLRALSARASAGEGGEWEVEAAGTDAHPQWWLHRNGRAFFNFGYGENAEFLAKSMARALGKHTAAPQPAHAGASGGGEVEIAEIMRGCLSAIEGGRDPRYGFSIGPSIEGIEEAAKRIAAMLATPASPATAQINTEALRGMFRALVDAGGATTVARHGVERGSVEWAHAVTVGMLAIERYLHPERFELDDFPSGIAAAPQPQEVDSFDPERDRLLNMLDTPLAPGEGEGDAFEAWAASQKYDMTKHPLHWLFLNERTYAARQGWKAGMEYALTTRPAPEARDAARFIVLRDALLGTNTAAMEYFKSNGAPTSVEQFNAYCDAALALPAQGEGNNG